MAELSLEQQFRQRSFEDLVSQLSLEQAQDMLVELHMQMLCKDKMYQQMLKDKWAFSGLS